MRRNNPIHNERTLPEQINSTARDDSSGVPHSRVAMGQSGRARGGFPQPHQNTPHSRSLTGQTTPSYTPHISRPYVVMCR